MSLGRIITFYSYKGGVGRSFALANIAAILAKWGARVLCVDWDLEAPGLHHFFPDARPPSGGNKTARSNRSNAADRGLVHLMESASASRKLDWRRCVHQADVGASGKVVDLIPAGRATDDYVERVHALDWQALYDEHKLGEFLDALRVDWKKEYDYILLDSRTGLTDIGGICTVHLPDFIVQVFSANHQSMEGTKHVAEQVKQQRGGFFYSSGQALILPLLARWEEKDAPDDAKAWLSPITELVSPMYGEWKHKDASARRLLELLKVPYKAKWNFGERLAVLEESATDPGSVAYHLHLVAALLVRDFEGSDELCASPDSYVRSAEGIAKNRRKKVAPRTEPAPQAQVAEASRPRPVGSANDEARELEQLALHLRKLDLAVARGASKKELGEIRAFIHGLRKSTGLDAPSTPRRSPAGPARGGARG